MVLQSIDIMNGNDTNEFKRFNVISGASLNPAQDMLTVTTTSTSTRVLDDVTTKMHLLCEGVRNIANSFLRLVTTNTDAYDRKAVLQCANLLFKKISEASELIDDIIAGLKECLNKIKKAKPESNNSENERKTKETFDEAITPIRQFLQTRSSDLSKSFNLLVETCKQSFIENYNKNNTDVLTMDRFGQSFVDQNDFKIFFYEALTKTPMWFAIMKIGMYTPVSEKSYNFCSNIIKKRTTGGNVPDGKYFSDMDVLCGFGKPPSENKEDMIVKALDTLDRLNSHISEVEKNVSKGMFSYSLNDYYGGQPNDMVPTHSLISSQATYENSRGFSSTPVASEIEKTKLSKQIIETIHKLHDEITKFIEKKMTCILIKNSLAVILNTDTSITTLFQEFVRHLMKTETPVEFTNFMTSDMKMFYQITLRKIKNEISPNKNSHLIPFIPAIQYVLTYLDAWFPVRLEKADSTEPTEVTLGSSLVVSDCKDAVNRYFNPRMESEQIQLIVDILDALNELVVKQFFTAKGIQVSAFCIINDFTSETGDFHLYRRIFGQNSEQLLETFHPDNCESGNRRSDAALDSVTSAVNSSGNTPPTTSVVGPTRTESGVHDNRVIQIPFTFIFDRCELSSIINWINLSKELEKRSVCMMTFGYSGTGKSVTTMGKFIPADRSGGKGDIFIKGTLQSAMETLRMPFYIEVLEIYGRALPLNESFNINDSNNASNDGFIKSIAWIKQYTKHASVVSSDTYNPDQDTADRYVPSKFIHETDENVPGALISSPDKIKEYFNNRLSKEFIENNMKYVKKEDVLTYLTHISDKLVDPIDVKRRRLRTIFFTPNNPDSSRSILIFTMAFKFNDNYNFLSIIDFPGKEDPIKTYVYDIPRDYTIFKDEIKKNYGDMYSTDTINLYMQKFAEKISGNNTYLNLMVLNPLILIGTDFALNSKFITNLNNLISYTLDKLPADEKKKFKSDMFKIIQSVGHTKIPDTVNHIENEIELYQLIRPRLFYIDYTTFADSVNSRVTDMPFNENLQVEFPQLYNPTGTPPENNLVVMPFDNYNFGTRKSNKNSFIYKATLPKMHLGKGPASNNGAPNVLRQFYLTVIIEQLLKSFLFTNSQIISILLQSLNDSINYNHGQAYSLKRFLNCQNANDTMFICDRLNNAFESYFINELVSILIRDISIYTGIKDPKTTFERLQQGDNLKTMDRSMYSLKRLFSTGKLNNSTDVGNTENYGGDPTQIVGEEIVQYNPITRGVNLSNPTFDNAGKIYTVTVTGNDNDELDYLNVDFEHPEPQASDSAEIREKRHLKATMTKESDKLYDYSKCISKIDNNQIFNVMKIVKLDKQMSFYFMYTVSSVKTDQKCKAANSLLKSMKGPLGCLVYSKCDNLS